MKTMYYVTKSLLTGLPVLSVLFQLCVAPRSRSYAMASLETQFVLRESCAYRRVNPLSVVEQFDSLDVPTASQSLAWTAVRLFSEQESSQYRKVTKSLGWAITMCSGPPATLDCKKRSNSRLAESRRRVDGFPATAFVNWQIVVQWRVRLCIAGQSRCPLSRPYSVPRTTGRSGRRRHFRRGILNIILCRGCLIHISVFLVAGDRCDPAGRT